ncbi:PRTRC system protein B [Sphingomonas sp.]|uniref:PRTRC system protein B n=1 Tax=Sphingomonas sp. TaxID=28214 RepID=UPI003BAB711E
MKHSCEFEATPGGLVLSGAILLYTNGITPGGAPRAGATAFASIHSVAEVDGAPVIAAGAPLTRAHLQKWAEALERNAVPEILPENVLVAHPDMLVWWIPAQVRTAYFALSNPPKDLKRLTERTAVPVPYPAHLFVATRSGLGVYALPASERPRADTPILCSPVLNVFVTGQLCWGNIVRPKTLDVGSMQEFEDAVFDSWSTHPNPAQERTIKGKGGLVRLWDDLAARGARRFPVSRLRPFIPSNDRQRPADKKAEPLTLRDLIARSARA